jgi:hypothetical protein
MQPHAAPSRAQRNYWKLLDQPVGHNKIIGNFWTNLSGTTKLLETSGPTCRAQQNYWKLVDQPVGHNKFIGNFWTNLSGTTKLLETSGPTKDGGGTLLRNVEQTT